MALFIKLVFVSLYLLFILYYLNYLQLFKKAPKEWFNQDIARDIEIIRTFRGQVSEAIEPMRRDKQIKSSLEASVAGPKNSDLVKAASNLGISLKNYVPL